MNDYEQEIASLIKELGITRACAIDVLYLRTRVRHTPELEEELIALHRSGERPDMQSFGVPPGGSQIMKDVVKAAKERYTKTP